MKKGDKVRNTGAVTQEARERVGEIVLVKVPGMSDCALVRFDPTSDGFCLPRRLLEVIK